MPTNRIITDEQFRPGTTIDGDRLDRAYQGVVDTVNDVGPDLLVRRHHVSRFVAGYQPHVLKSMAGDDNLPWLVSYHDASWTNPAGGPPPGTTIQNPYRVKGQENPGVPLYPQFGSGDSMQYLWTQMFAFSDPVILDSVSCFMVGDSNYLNDFVYGAMTPGHTTGESVDDILLEVSVSSPYAPENTLLGNLAYHKLKFRADYEASSHVAPPFTTHGDMLPAHPAGFAYMQVAVVDLGLNVPLPRDSRIRFSVLVPQYSTGSGGWQAAGLRGAQYGLGLTVLEPTKK